MRKLHTTCLGAVLLMALCLPLAVSAQQTRSQPNRNPVEGDNPGTLPGDDPNRIPLYAQVVIFDVNPASVQDFEAALLATREMALAEAGLINERVLRNIDELTVQYATYTRFSDRGAAARLHESRAARLQAFLLREPEVHLVEVTNAYFPEGITDRPTGLELGLERVGQIAHLGLFVPYPKYRRQYDDALHHVKVVLKERKSAGYIGEEIGTEVELLAPAAQSPYSPRAFEPSRMSVNYGEYDTMENAENAYITRHAKHDPMIVHLERSFFSALQVPTRFYLFQVIGNYSQPGIAARVRARASKAGGK